MSLETCTDVFYKTRLLYFHLCMFLFFFLHYLNYLSVCIYITQDGGGEMAQCEGCAAWVHAHCDEHAWRLLHPPPGASTASNSGSTTGSASSKHFFCPSCVVDPQCTQHFGPLPLLPPSSVSSMDEPLESAPSSQEQQHAQYNATVKSAEEAEECALSAGAKAGANSAASAAAAPVTAAAAAAGASTAPENATPADKATALAMQALGKAERRAARQKVRQQWEAQRAQRSNLTLMRRAERHRIGEARAKAIASHNRARDALARAENRHRVAQVVACVFLLL
jgi:hypothetical protein